MDEKTQARIKKLQALAERGVGGENVTCPVCERQIYKANDREVMKVARGSRQAKVNNHYIQLDSYGRFKD